MFEHVFPLRSQGTKLKYSCEENEPGISMCKLDCCDLGDTVEVRRAEEFPNLAISFVAVTQHQTGIPLRAATLFIGDIHIIFTFPVALFHYRHFLDTAKSRIYSPFHKVSRFNCGLLQSHFKEHTPFLAVLEAISS